MIISEIYDKSLWLVTHGDKKNRNVIIDFINSIPDSLYDKIRDSVVLINKYRCGDISCKDMDYNKLHDSVVTPDDLMYWYYIDPYNYGVTLGYAICNDYDDMFALTLYPFYEEDIRNSKKKYTDIIGSFKNMEYCDDESNYYIVKDIIHGLMFYSLSKDRVRYRNVYLTKMPENLEFSDLKKSKECVLKRVLCKKFSVDVGEL